MLSPDLFTSLTPPGIQVLVSPLAHQEADVRQVTLTLRPPGGRAISVRCDVSRYSPEHTILQAVAHTLEELAVLQASVTRTAVKATFDRCIVAWVDPF